MEYVELFFSEREGTLAIDESGAVLFDCDVTYFMPVLNYLRRGEIVIEPDKIGGVLAEAKYLGIQPLIERLGGSTSGFEKVTWSSIGGLDGVKEELQQVVGDSVRYAEMFQRCGVSPSKNLLLYGPPGCGKTLLAKATANEIKANFMMIKCPELLGGNGERVIQEKFSQARALQPCVVYLEEFESIAHLQGEKKGEKDFKNSKSEPALIVNQMAISLDDILVTEKVFVFAATNRPDLIEPVLLRPGRFDQVKKCKHTKHKTRVIK